MSDSVDSWLILKVAARFRLSAPPEKGTFSFSLAKAAQPYIADCTFTVSSGFISEILLEKSLWKMFGRRRSLWKTWNKLSVSHIQNGLRLNSMSLPLVRGVRQAVCHHPVVSYGALWCRREMTLVLFSVLLLMSKCCPVLTKLLTLQHPHCKIWDLKSQWSCCVARLNIVI